MVAATAWHWGDPELRYRRARPWPRPRELSDLRGEILASGLFRRVAVTQFDWEVSYDAEAYIDLLETFSGHIAMRPWQRGRLYAEIRRRLAGRPDGRLRVRAGRRIRAWKRGQSPPGGDCPHPDRSF